MTADAVTPPQWRIVVPVKRLEVAKSRLALAPALRADLVLAMALDTVAAALECRQVGRVTVVTSDMRVRAAFTGPGVAIVEDVPDEGLNRALEHGIGTTGADGPTATLSADLPALRPSELQRALDAAAPLQRAVVADASGTGTTLLAARTGAQLRPQYGPDSLRKHELAGYAVLALDGIAGLQRDVDTIEDLSAVARLGAGRHTVALLEDAGIAALHPLPLR